MPFYAVQTRERRPQIGITVESQSVLHEFPTRDRRDAWVSRGNAWTKVGRRALDAREARAVCALRENQGMNAVVRHSFIKPEKRKTKSR